MPSRSSGRCYSEFGACDRHRIGRYRIEARLGAGGMGIVYRAFDTELRRPVALKILATDLDAGSRTRLLREARAASALNHPHICTIHEVGEADGQAFLVMEYVDGQDLSDVWAFGILLCEMTTGRRPFGGGTSFELVSSVLRDSMPALPATVPAGLAAVIHRCLAREPDRRYQRAGEVHAALETIAPSAASIGVSAAGSNRLRRRRRRRRLLQQFVDQKHIGQ